MSVVDVGTYKVALKVQDEYEKWSNVYEQEFEMLESESVEPLEESYAIETESLDNYKITYEDGDTIFEDHEIFKGGKYSIRLDKNEKGNSQSITIQDLKLYNYSSFSMWIMSSSGESIGFEIKGYKNGSIGYQKRLSYKPSSANYWEMFHVNDRLGNLDELKITISNHGSSLWLDELELELYK